jgi:predicted ATPase/class 3 adenylate cyclase
MECPSCGASVAERKRFCSDCGAAMPILCTACGTASRPGARFCGDCGASLAADAGVPAAARGARPGTPAPGRSVREAERRQLTVMFCDLVGSAALAARLDPEDMREVIRAYRECCGERVVRFDGHVAQYLGDGLLVYFGYPHAHEDNAERAVRAALAIVEAVGRLKPRSASPLQVRVGIATGLVVVGDLIGHGAGEEAAVGETPNLAARLQALAEPDSVVIAASTRRLIGDVFECVDLGIRHVKGFAEPVQAWRVVAETQAESRFEAQHTAGLTPLVGRDREVTLLFDCWRQAKAGEGQVVLLSGEPGIGKSRILRVLRDRLGDEPHIRLRYSCSPYHQTSALYPFIEQLERAAGIAREDAPDRKLDKLEALLAQGAASVESSTPLIAALLSIPTGGRYPSLAISPQRHKEKTLEALVAQLEGLATRHPVLMLFEDAHWIDPTSLELLDLIVERAQGLSVLLVVTFRPEFTPPWTGHAHVTALTLSRLTRRQVVAMIDRVAGGKALPPSLLEQIGARTDGVPLFVEELTKAVMESSLVKDQGDHYALTGPLPPLAIPATLQDSLMARLDRLAPAKEVAQIGAALGREFSFELLAAVSPLPANALEDAVAELVRTELVFRRGVPPEATYSFKHALVQDAAYGTLLRSRRQQLHARIAQVLEERFPETVNTQPDLLAHHCTEAGFVAKAIDYWRRAALGAAARSAIAEAVAQLTKGFNLLPGLPEAERSRQELGLQMALGKAITSAKGFAAPAGGTAYARARELCAQLGETLQLFPILYGLTLFHLYRGEMTAAHEVSQELLQLAEREGGNSALFYAHRAVGVSSLPYGRLTAVRAHMERALALYDPVEHRDLAVLYAFDPHVVCLDYLSRALLPLGYPEQAVARHGEALAEGRQLAHLTTLAFTLFFGCTLHQILHDRARVLELATVLIPLAEEQAFPIWLAGGLILQGWVLTDTAQVEMGITQMRQGLDAWRATGAEFMVPYFLALLAEAHAKVSQSREGLGLVAQALERVERSGERWFEAELHRLRGELLLARPSRDEAQAEEALHRALGVARAQQARLWELRAATSLCRLWLDRAKETEGRALLAPIYDEFTEGFGTPDLLNAKALLDGLGASASTGRRSGDG